MMKREWIGGIGLILLTTVLFFPTAAAGQYVEIQWLVTGSSSQGGTITTDLDWDVINANPLITYAWNLPGTMDIDLGGGAGIAHIDGLSIGVKADPFIDFAFAARSANGPTHFAFSSALLIVNPALTNAQASAWAYPSPGVPDTITAGDFSNNKVYRAEYNGGTVFADLSDAPIPFLPPGNGYDAIGSTPISGQVSSMQVHWGLTVSAGGQASGTSRFEIMGDVVPEPASVILLGLGGLALIRKRRA
jgi:hypothetical protein